MHHHALFRRARHDVDMTQGSVFKHLFLFSLPLLAGNLFQQLYNLVDTWVVGNYVSNEAFSAVGTVTPIINMLIGSFMGLSSGAGVVISQYYGAKRYDRVRDAVHTAIAMTAILAVAFTTIGIWMTPTMLRFMKTPAEVMPNSTAYLTIYFSGMAGLMFYNMGAGILRAVGDSTRPFYYLVVTAGINVALDLLFVIKFHMGVEGVAYATIIAQGISAALTVITLMRSATCVQLDPKRLRLHLDILKKIVRVGIPAALQMALTAFSNVFVQSYINQFGPDCMSGWTAFHKIDQFIFLPVQSLGLAATTFVGQNLGSEKPERARAGVSTAIRMGIAATVVIGCVVMLNAPHLIIFFNDKPEVVTYGTLFLRQITPFYLLCCFNQIYAGALRGAGDTRAPMVIMLCSFVGFRQLYLYVVSRFISNTVLAIGMGYPAGWLMCTVCISTYYHRNKLNRSKLDLTT